MRHLDADHLGLELRIALDLLARNQPGLEDRLIVIDVGEEAVDRSHALGEALFEIAPLVGRDDARDHVGRDQPPGAAFVAVHGEGDADAAEQQVGLGAALGERLLRRRIAASRCRRRSGRACPGFATLRLPAGGWLWLCDCPRSAPRR